MEFNIGDTVTLPQIKCNTINQRDNTQHTTNTLWIIRDFAGRIAVLISEDTKSGTACHVTHLTKAQPVGV